MCIFVFEDMNRWFNRCYCTLLIAPGHKCAAGHVAPAGVDLLPINLNLSVNLEEIKFWV